MQTEQAIKDLKAIIDECSWRSSIQSFVVIEMVEKVIKQLTPTKPIETPQQVQSTPEEQEYLSIEKLRELYKDKFQKKPFA
jgi:hypothetical protein